MSTIAEIDNAIDLIKKYTESVYYNCIAVSSYPTADEDINLNIIPTLRDRYKCPVGYSGHERGIAICVICSSTRSMCYRKAFYI